MTDGRLSLTADDAALGVVLDWAEAHAEALALPASSRQHLLLILDELLSNALQHGRPPQNSQLELSVQRTETALLIRYSDAATAFNPLQYPDPDTTLDVEQRPIGGLGLFLTRQLCQRAEYEHCNGRNCLRLWLPLN